MAELIDLLLQGDDQICRRLMHRRESREASALGAVERTTIEGAPFGHPLNGAGIAYVAVEFAGGSPAPAFAHEAHRAASGGRPEVAALLWSAAAATLDDADDVARATAEAAAAIAVAGDPGEARAQLEEAIATSIWHSRTGNEIDAGVTAATVLHLTQVARNAGAPRLAANLLLDVTRSNWIGTLPRHDPSTPPLTSLRLTRSQSLHSALWEELLVSAGQSGDREFEKRVESFATDRAHDWLVRRATILADTIRTSGAARPDWSTRGRRLCLSGSLANARMVDTFARARTARPIVRAVDWAAIAVCDAWNMLATGPHAVEATALSLNALAATMPQGLTAACAEEPFLEQRFDNLVRRATELGVDPERLLTIHVGVQNWGPAANINDHLARTTTDPALQRRAALEAIDLWHRAGSDGAARNALTNAWTLAPTDRGWQRRLIEVCNDTGLWNESLMLQVQLMGAAQPDPDIAQRFMDTVARDDSIDHLLDDGGLGVWELAHIACDLLSFTDASPARTAALGALARNARLRAKAIFSESSGLLNAMYEVAGIGEEWRSLRADGMEHMESDLRGLQRVAELATGT